MKSFLADPRRAKIVSVLALIAFVTIIALRGPGSGSTGTEFVGVTANKVAEGDMTYLLDAADRGNSAGVAMRNAGGLPMVILLLLLLYLVYAFWPRRT